VSRIKPFPYDVVETSGTLLFVFPYQGADGRPAVTTVAPNGLQLDRADGAIIRIGNLHPRLREVLGTKRVFVCEVRHDVAVLYGTDGCEGLGEPLARHIGSAFYWYIGPETSTIREVAERPLASLLYSLLDGPVVVAPGEYLCGPTIGMCLTNPKIVTLARRRKWAQARPGLVIDAGLAAGTTTGFAITDDVIASVMAAHDDETTRPAFQPRRSWNSQIACAFRAAPDETSTPVGENFLEVPARTV
jgi:hypothetical protein